MGNLCGYVAIPPGHPGHGKSLHDFGDISVHWGVTYAEPCAGEVCHVPEPGEPDDVWWVGYDCGHGMDFMPAMEAHLKLLGAGESLRDLTTYRDLEYNIGECESLAKQLVEMGG